MPTAGLSYGRRVIGTAAWASALSLLGYNFGDTVTKFFHSFSVIGIVLVVVLILGLIAHRVHAVRKDSHRAAADGTPDPASASAGSQPRIGSGRSGGAHRSTGRGPTP